MTAHTIVAPGEGTNGEGSSGDWIGRIKRWMHANSSGMEETSYEANNWVKLPFCRRIPAAQETGLAHLAKVLQR